MHVTSILPFFLIIFSQLTHIRWCCARSVLKALRAFSQRLERFAGTAKKRNLESRLFYALAVVPDEVGATLNSIMGRHCSDTKESCRNLPREDAAVTMA